MKYRVSLGLAAALLGAVTVSGPATAAVRGKCVVTASSTGKSRYALVKCAKDKSPLNYVIRYQIWEKQDPKKYKEFARMAGHSFACELKRGGTTFEYGYEIEHYKIGDCH